MLTAKARQGMLGDRTAMWPGWRVRGAPAPALLRRCPAAPSLARGVPRASSKEPATLQEEAPQQPRPAGGPEHQEDKHAAQSTGGAPVMRSTSGLTPSSSSKQPGNNSQEPGEGPSLVTRLLLRIPLLGALLKRALKGDSRAISLVRMFALIMVFGSVVMVREFQLSRTRVVTHEVLYSQFSTLLNEGRIRAARLESGTGRLYFDTIPREATAAAAAEAATTASTTTAAAAGATAAAATAAATTAAASTSGQASAAPAAAAATAAAPSRTGGVPRQYVVKLPDHLDPTLMTRILQAGVEFGVVKKSFTTALQNTILTAFALWIPLLPLIFLLRRMMEDRTGGKKKVRDNKAQAISITFRDVAGVDSAKEELLEVVQMVRNSNPAYRALNAKMPSGVLLCGPPGTGKTLLAKAVAGEAGIPFLSASGSEFVELFVGRGAARVRELFAEARKNAPCVVFIDELDAVGARRGMGYNDERDQTLNQLLVELDGFDGRAGVLFLAATNRIETLDPALLRPGRINRKVVVPLPDEGGRQAILGVHLRNVPMPNTEDKAEACERLAKVTAGFSGAELANVVDEATTLAARDGKLQVTMRELLLGVNRTRNGVNGRTARPGGFGQGLQNWLMDIAAGPDDRKVKNAAV